MTKKSFALHVEIRNETPLRKSRKERIIMGNSKETILPQWADELWAEVDMLREKVRKLEKEIYAKTK